MRSPPLMVLVLMGSFVAEARVHRVRSYVKKSGTVVQSHYKSAPNKTRIDNFGTKGNVNLSTGKIGNKPVLKSP